MKHRTRTATAAATSTQTAHAYHSSVRGEKRVYERIEASLRTVLAKRRSRPLPPEQFDALFGDLPRDGEG